MAFPFVSCRPGVVPAEEGVALHEEPNAGGKNGNGMK
jgi:hypothetical protein